MVEDQELQQQKWCEWKGAEKGRGSRSGEPMLRGRVKRRYGRDEQSPRFH